MSIQTLMSMLEMRIAQENSFREINEKTMRENIEKLRSEVKRNLEEMAQECNKKIEAAKALANDLGMVKSKIQQLEKGVAELKAMMNSSG